MIQFTQPDAASFSVFISPDRSTDHHQLTLTQHLKAVPLWKAHSWTRYRTQNVEGTQLDTLQNAACGGHTAGNDTECSMPSQRVHFQSKASADDDVPLSRERKWTPLHCGILLNRKGSPNKLEEDELCEII